MEFVKNLQSFLQSCNKSLINQTCSGPYWENIGPWSFLYGPRCARSVLSRPRADILPVRPSRLVNKIYIYVIHQPGGPYWEKLCPRAVLKTEGTVFPNTDQPRLVNNIFIFFLKQNERRAKDRTFWGLNYGKIRYKLNNFWIISMKTEVSEVEERGFTERFLFT